MPTDTQPITVVFADQTVASRVVDLVVRNRPVGWARKSLATYYREEYAIKLLPALDNMIETRKPKVVRVDRLNLQSTYLWINQAWRFIIDYMDKDGKYKKLWDETSCSRVKGAGVSINFRAFADENLIAEDFVPKEDKVKWKKEIDDYLTDDKVTRPFHKDNLLLSLEEVEQLKSELEDLSNVQYSITCKEIKIVKLI